MVTAKNLIISSPALKLPVPFFLAKPQPALGALRPDPVIIIGMHRSGTSALGLVLEQLGLTVGKNVMSAQTENPKGYAENVSLMELHDEFLKSVGSSWQDPEPVGEELFQGNAAVGFREKLLRVLKDEFRDGRPLIKDPRMCRLMPLWVPLIKEHFPQASFILPIRHPVEVALALGKGRQLTLDQSLKLWVVHVLEGERATREFSRLFSTYDQLMKSPVQAVLPLAKSLGLSTEAVSAAVSARIDTKLWHQKDHFWPIGEPYEQLTLAIHQTLVSGGPAMQEDLDRLRQDYYGSMGWPC
jgi:hypothetical protein